MIMNAKITPLDGGEIRITATCVVTKKPYSVVVKRSAYNKWQSGILAQNAFPDLSLEDREFLISGTSPEGWNKMFGEESD